VINFLLSTEIIPLCLRTMETGSELSKTVATFIVQKILLDNVRACGAGGRGEGPERQREWQRDTGAGGAGSSPLCATASLAARQARRPTHSPTRHRPLPARPPARAGWSELHLRHC
jgi:hypothetical protein